MDNTIGNIEAQVTARIAEIDDRIDTLVKQRQGVNDEVRDLRAERDPLVRLLRATKPRRSPTPSPVAVVPEDPPPAA
jgi:uncharacterized coiled-coil DUF342 family protein